MAEIKFGTCPDCGQPSWARHRCPHEMEAGQYSFADSCPLCKNALILGKHFPNSFQDEYKVYCSKCYFEGIVSNINYIYYLQVIK